MKKTLLLILFASAFILSACNSKTKALTPDEARQIAEEAYIYAYPMLEHYKMMFAMAMCPESGAYNAAFNILVNNSTLNGPQDTIIVRPNNDTFYSAVWFDLSVQPQILSVPEITDGRYYSFQIIDMYTYNIDYVGSRKTGNGAGKYMFTGPDWEGEVPEGIDKVIRSEGNYLLALGRTQVFGPDDIEQAQAVMNGYTVESLGQYIGQDMLIMASPLLNLPHYNPQKANDENFIGYFNALMAMGKIHPSEKDMFERFAKIGVKPGEPYNPEDYDSGIIKAVQEGIESGRKKFMEASASLGERKNQWQLVAGAFGTRKAMEGKYLTRASAAYFGLWGNDLEEAFYPESTFDADGDELDGSKHDYILHFDEDELPPAKAFWSLTMYKLPEQLLIENEINRYIIGSATKGLQYNSDGSLDIYIQKETPGEGKISNWLPANDGLFSLQTRIYWPEPNALNPLYAMPAIQKK